MNYLIVYMSHHGTTQKVVNELREKIGKEKTTIINLENDTPPPLDEFDTVIIGGSIHMGKIQKQISAFCETYMEVLLRKHLGLFLCYMNLEQGQKEFDDAFPLALRRHALANGLFGGELLLERMNFTEKVIVKSVSKLKKSVSALNENAIETFAETMQT